MSEITAQEFFRADEVPDDCALSSVELKRVFWRFKEMQREAQRQQAFWKAVNDSMEDAYTKLAGLKEELRASKEQLKEANERLEQTVAERTSALADARTPIIQVWRRVLALPIVGGLDRARVEEMTHGLLQAIVGSRSSFAILDLTGVKEVDAATADHLLRISQAVGLLGARCLLSGISGAVARSFTSLEIDLRAIVSFSTLESALHYALQHIGELPGARAV